MVNQALFASTNVWKRDRCEGFHSAAIDQEDRAKNIGFCPEQELAEVATKLFTFDSRATTRGLFAKRLKCSVKSS